MLLSELNQSQSDPLKGVWVTLKVWSLEWSFAFVNGIKSSGTDACVLATPPSGMLGCNTVLPCNGCSARAYRAHVPHNHRSKASSHRSPSSTEKACQVQCRYDGSLYDQLPHRRDRSSRTFVRPGGTPPRTDLRIDLSKVGIKRHRLLALLIDIAVALAE